MTRIRCLFPIPIPLQTSVIHSSQLNEGYSQVQKQCIVRLSPSDKPLHAPDDVFARGEAGGVLLVVCEDDNVFGAVVEAFCG